ncbi:hypothetical protein RFI_33958, partial [Reticulomyxa filosa]
SDSKSKNQSFNTWIRHNQDSSIGKLENNLIGVRGLIGGKNNDLLFITYCPENIEVIDLKTMKSLNGIKNTIMPTKEHKFGASYHCFVPLTINNEKMINHFIFFCYNTGLLIKYDEQNKIFNYEKLPICHSLDDFNMYSFVYIYDYIFLFGGADSEWRKTKLVCKYSMKDKTWNQCKLTLPMEVFASFAIFSGDDTNVHVIGGFDAKDEEQKMHVSVNVEELFEKSELLKMPEI